MIMFQMLLGHLVADYLFQNEWMAMNKSQNTYVGWNAALIHCIIYTLAVCLFMWKFDNLWVMIVFLTHFPIDKFALANVYMHYIKGKSMKNYVKKDDWMGDIKYAPIAKKVLNRYDILEGGFTSIVYTVTDNTMHILLMYIAYQILY